MAQNQRSRKVFLHIGLPKTGTKTIQAWLNRNREEFLDRGILYPESTGQPKSSLLLPYSVEIGFKRYDLPENAPKDQAGFRIWLEQRLLEEVAATDCDTIILSDEALGARLRLDTEVDHIKRLFDKISDDVHIICWMRRQDEAALSTVWDGVREGRADALAFPPTGKFEGQQYFEIATRWAKAFGKDRLILRRYGSAYGDDVLAEFIELTGVDTSGVSAPPRMNNSPNERSLLYIHLVNQHLGKWWTKQERASLARLTDHGLDDKKLGASRRDRESFLSLFEKTNNRVAAEFFGLEGPLFTHEIPDDPISTLNWQEMLQFTAKILEKFRFSFEAIAPRRRWSLASSGEKRGPAISVGKWPSAPDGLKVIGLHRIDETNPGDLWSTPLSYFANGDRYDIYEDAQEAECDVLILGGGAIISAQSPWIEGLTSWMDSIKFKKAVIWGAMVPPNFKNLDIINRFDIVGARNIDSGQEFLPCASCMHPIFDNAPMGTGLGRISHKKRPIPGDGIGNAPNSLEAVVDYIKQHSTIVTTSYHAAYWSLLLDRKVYIYAHPDFKNPGKMLSFSVQPQLVSSLDEIVIDPGERTASRKLLDEYRKLNRAFAKRVLG